jgi:hypothetical protein
MDNRKNNRQETGPSPINHNDIKLIELQLGSKLMQLHGQTSVHDFPL